ncbi:MAG: SpoIIE family protein phosphatase [bacterium]|nr:SpoIIE family protein phosphatase [bacterium]
MKRSYIFVVDDEPAMLRTVTRILERGHEVRGFTSPRAALELAHERRPDLAVIDIRMPEMDGFELMNELERLDEHIRVILMTGSAFDTDKKLIRAIREKAFFYIQKPFEREVLRTLVERCLEIQTLEEANRGYLAHLEHQLAEARAFQQTMLPARRANLEGFEIQAAYEPCTELAGDLYDYVDAGPGRVTLLIADVVGHGASAAMLTSLVKSAFRASYPDYEPLAVVERVAENVAAFEPGRFVTLLCARISLQDRRVDYVNAGHEGGMLAGRDGTPRPLASTGPLISPVLRDLGWEQKELPWTDGSLLLLFTDGISETASGDEMFEVERLRAIVRRHAEEGDGLLDTILREVRDFAAGRPAADDITLLMARQGKGAGRGGDE